MVGRDRDLNTAKKMLDGNARLITVHGPGGVGKTKLALRVATIQAKRFATCTWLDLRPLAEQSNVSAELLLSHVTLALGLRRIAPVTADAVRDHLGKKPALLVLDNCDQLIAEVRPVVRSLQSAVPNLSIIATSRVELTIEGEHVLRLRPLDIDDAVDLFSRHAVMAGAVAGALDDAKAVRDACERCDRLPLALRLTAVEVGRGLPVGDLVELLEADRFGLLTPMERAVTISYDTCSPDEQQVWQRLAVFVSGFDWQAATAVAGGDGVDPGKVRPLISQLVAKSVISVDTVGRYRMLDTMRDYGLRRLGEAGGTQRVRELHRDYYGDVVAHAAGTWLGTDEVAIMADLYRRLDDILAAIDHALARNDIVTAVTIAINLIRTRTPHFHGFLDMSAQVLRRVVNAVGPAPEPSVDAELTGTDRAFGELAAITAAALGWILATQGRAAEADAMAALADDHLTSRGLPRPPQLWYLLGAIEALVRGNRKAVDMLRRALELIPDTPDNAGDRHMARMMLSIAADCDDDTAAEEAVDIAREYLAEAELAGGPWSIAWAMWAAALAELKSHHLDQAAKLNEGSVIRERQLDDNWGGLWVTDEAAWIIGARLESLEHAERRVEAERAARLLGAATARRAAMGVDLAGLVPLGAIRARAQSQIETVLDTADFIKFFEAGRKRPKESFKVALREASSRRPSARSRDRLTNREFEVVRLVAAGLTNPEIAVQMNVSGNTVNTHLKNISRKLGLHNRAGIAVWAAKNNHLVEKV